mgnify:CR=1 FL=1
MAVIIKFETDNASFDGTMEDHQEEIIQTLVSVIDSIRKGKNSGLVIDVNGNRIGSYTAK